MQQMSSDNNSDGECQQEADNLFRNVKEFFNKHKEKVGDHKPWRVLRATIVSKPEEVLEINAGEMIFVEIEILNNTFAPYKQGCYVAMHDGALDRPFEPIRVPIDFPVPAKTQYKIKVPIKALTNAENGEEYELKLTLRGPNGWQFGEPIDLKVLVNGKMGDDEFFENALKLHQLGHGTFDECVEALKSNNRDWASAVEYLSAKKK